MRSVSVVLQRAFSKRLSADPEWKRIGEQIDLILARYPGKRRWRRDFVWKLPEPDREQMQALLAQLHSRVEAIRREFVRQSREMTRKGDNESL